MNTGFKKKEIDLGFLPSIKDVQYSAYATALSDDAEIMIFCCISSGEQVIEKNWKSVMDSIAHDYLTGEVSSFVRWNSYLVFICDEEVPKTLKYEIENDKFAMRKIVEKKPDGWDDACEKSLIDLLNQRLLLSYIDLSEYKTEDSPAPVLSKWGRSVADQKVPSDPHKDSSKEARDAWVKDALKSAVNEVSNEN